MKYFLDKYVRELSKRLVFNYTPFGKPTYGYNLEPIQLATIVNEIDRTSSFSGNILEVGVARGMTTRFILEHLKSNANININNFYVLDTFNSFLRDDLMYEVSYRNKSLWKLKGFNYITLKSWSKNFIGEKYLKIICCDCKSFDYRTVAPIKFALIDVDLYLPTLAALEGIFRVLSDDGSILIDDCRDGVLYDGAFAAFNTFINKKNVNYKRVGNKSILLYKN